MKNQFRLALAAILMALGLVAVPSLAAADTCPECNGGRIYLTTNSDIRIAISNSYTVTPSSTRYLYPGQSSWLVSGFFRDVDKFWIGPGCTGISQYGGRYSGGPASGSGVWFSMSSDSVYLSLNHQCW